MERLLPIGMRDRAVVSSVVMRFARDPTGTTQGARVARLEIKPQSNPKVASAASKRAPDQSAYSL